MQRRLKISIDAIAKFLGSEIRNIGLDRRTEADETVDINLSSPC